MTLEEEAIRALDGRDWYYFRELDSVAQQAVLDRHELFPDWHDYTLEELTGMLEDVGVRNAKIGYSGFSSQGDGAHFTGTYRYAKGGAEKYKREWPKDVGLHKILDELQDLQRKHFYKLEVDILHRGMYQHENCTVFDGDEILEEPLRDLMRYCYKRLEWEYDYQMGEGAKEFYAGCDYEFNEDGSVYHG